MPRDNKKEQFVVVNKNDKIIEHRTRFECHHNPKLIHRAVDIVIFNKKGEVLLQKRSQFKDTNPGFYGLSTAGHVAVGESYKQAAVREIMEEIGVKMELIFKGKHFYQDERESEMTAVYVGNHDGPFKIDKQEVESVKFYFPYEIAKIRNKITPGALFTFKKLGIIK